MEVAIRRLSAIQIADESGSWEAASQIEDGHVGLLSKKQRKQMLEAAKLARAVATRPEPKGRPGGVPRPEFKENKPARKGKAGGGQ